ncbi:uncharacterized protein LOC122650186 [Telopea speciosissima]|uniref:uncharacterized protein LOC122650186 n=1 Tax=Telopea speciosissima TaxID=54955 RepID=UPI001CC6330B|nr:uncharacterized protein LOC122650186 [Telopea speciosissima]
MGRTFHVGADLCHFLGGARLVHPRPLCSNNSIVSKGNNNENSNKDDAIRDDDVYRQLEKLDFMTAAKILFTTPPKKKKFGLDFHLVQLFFACMPSLAVFLVAQYARYEIRRMEAEVELKKKQEEEKAKEMELNVTEENEEVDSDPELLKVKVRLDALEETLKEIIVETKKLSSGNDKREGSTSEHHAAVSSSPQNKSEDSTCATQSNSIKSKPDSSQ